MATVGQVGIDEVKTAAGQAGTMLVDVRLPFDFFGGRIPGSVNLPHMLIQERTNEIPAATRLIFICDDGTASAVSADAAIEAGFTNVSILEGGIDAWYEAGLPVETISDTQ